ncbi:hypothetical protein DID76_02355 [Candidatus Marinamargulisbacteria bacterium SCGC AG-414-C22]|nr:hypothetical protein DID76_02355 [Candidatus Marinamargulisbacteria bacterium SCGC AG-414-C22]
MTFLERNIDCCSDFELEKWETLSKKIRKKIISDSTRQIKRLKEQGKLETRFLQSYKKTEKYLDNFWEFRKKRWGHNKSYSCSSNTEDFVKSLINKTSDNILFSGLYLNDTPIALSLSFLKGNTIYYYIPVVNPSFLKFSPGRLLLIDTIKWAISKKYTTFDFLYGEEPYKFEWPVNKNELISITIYNHKIKSILGHFADKNIKPTVKKFYEKYVR